MSDNELVREILSQILAAANRVERRSAGIGKPDDFLASDEEDDVKAAHPDYPTSP